MKKNNLLYLFLVCFLISWKLEAQTFSGGDGSASSPYLISTIADLAEINDYPSFGNYYQLTNDIIGVTFMLDTFCGNFNGAGNTIEINLTAATGLNMGLIASASNGCRIRNLTVIGEITCSTAIESAGGIIATYYTTGTVPVSLEITNCRGEVDINVPANIVGGIIGKLTKIGNAYCSVLIDSSVSVGSISNYSSAGNVCVGGIVGGTTLQLGSVRIFRSYSDSNTITGAARYAGGIIGSSQMRVIIDSCYSGTNFALTFGSSNFQISIGGILGEHSYKDIDSTLSITNCKNYGHIALQSGKYVNVGGIVGSFVTGISTNAPFCVIENCHNLNYISLSTLVSPDTINTGGILGYTNDSTNIQNCYNRGAISISGQISRVGGIVGNNVNQLYINYCHNYGNIEVASSAGLTHAGGILGDNLDGSACVINCRNAGNITATGNSHHYDIGGIVGDNMSEMSISYCVNVGTISTPHPTYGYMLSIGGIAGYSQSNGLLEKNHNAGYVKGMGNVGGIMGHIGTSGGTLSNLNNGVVVVNAYSTNNKIGGIIGLRDNNTGAFSNNIYDKQMCIYGGVNNTDITANSSAVGILTSECLGTSLSSIMGGNAVYNAATYPMIKYSISTPPYTIIDSICKVASSPACLYQNLPNYERHNSIIHNFVVSDTNNIFWTSNNANIVSITGTSATLTGDGTCYIFPNLGNIKRTIPLTTAHWTLKTRTNNDECGSTSPDSVWIQPSGITNAIIIATPAECCEFVHWEDTLGHIISTKATDTISVTSDSILVAVFVKTNYVLSLSSNGGGSVNGGGPVACGTLDTITATSNDCYAFVNWIDVATGKVYSTKSTDTITILNDRTLIANFVAVESWSVKFRSEPANAGVVPNDTSITCGDSIAIDATAGECYSFSYWLDSATGKVSMQAKCKFRPENNTTIIAFFAVDSINVNTYSNPANAGITTVNGLYAKTKVACGNDFVIKAVPIDNKHKFVNWTDSATGSIFSIKDIDTLSIKSKLSLIANFEAIKDTTAPDTTKPDTTTGPNDSVTYIVSLNSNYSFANFYGAGMYNAGDTATIFASPNDVNCASFVNWTDEQGKVISSNNPCKIVVTNDTTITANFNLTSFVFIRRVNNSSLGFIIGSSNGFYNCDTLNITAIPNDSTCEFINWTSESVVISESPNLVFFLQRDTDVIANFISNVGVSETKSLIEFAITPNPADDQAVISCYLPKDAYLQLSVSNMLGNEIMAIYNDFVSLGAFSKQFSLAGLSQGVYYVKIWYDNKLKFQKLIKY